LNNELQEGRWVKISRSGFGKIIKVFGHSIEVETYHPNKNSRLIAGGVFSVLQQSCKLVCNQDKRVQR